MIGQSQNSQSEWGHQRGLPFYREALLTGRLSTIDLLVLKSLDLLLLTIKNYLLYYKTSYLNKEVNRTEPSPSVSTPCLLDPDACTTITINGFVIQTQ